MPHPALLPLELVELFSESIPIRGVICAEEATNLIN